MNIQYYHQRGNTKVDSGNREREVNKNDHIGQGTKCPFLTQVVNGRTTLMVLL